MFHGRRVKKAVLTAAVAGCLTLSASVNAYAATPAEYSVIGGDSLFKISGIFSTTVELLMKDNNLTSAYLDIGQVLAVPCDTYTVIKGDTLYLIAKKFKIPLDNLRRANNIYSDALNIGQILNIPGRPVAETGQTDRYETDQTGINSGSSYTAEELDLLARLVHAEAQGEPYDAKVAVGAVVMNRVKNSSWPDSLEDVIYQKSGGYYQFTPVVNGWINKPAGTDAVKAAKDALNGTDPSRGAQFYYDNQTTNAWILSKPVSVRIGTMVFAY